MYIYVIDWMPKNEDLPHKTIALMTKSNCNIKVISKFNTIKNRNEKAIIRSTNAKDLLAEYKYQDPGALQETKARLIRDHYEIKKIITDESNRQGKEK